MVIIYHRLKWWEINGIHKMNTSLKTLKYKCLIMVWNRLEWSNMNDQKVITLKDRLFLKQFEKKKNFLHFACPSHICLLSGKEHHPEIERRVRKWGDGTEKILLLFGNLPFLWFSHKKDQFWKVYESKMTFMYNNLRYEKNININIFTNRKKN